MLLDKQGNRLPDFFIVGVARSGTTALYSLLKKNPRVFMPQEKEPMFFLCWNQPKFLKFIGENKKAKTNFTISNLEEYKKTFKKARKNQVLGEGSTWYLYAHETVIPNIKKLYGKKYDLIKIIILLRDPVQRAWSHYWKKVTQGNEYLPFSEAVDKNTIKRRLEEGSIPSYDYIGFGHYYSQVKAYMNNFSKVKIMLFEEFIKNPNETTKEILQFLGINKTVNIKKTKYTNPGGVPRNFASSIIDKLIFKPGKWRASIKHILPFGTRRDLKNLLRNIIYKKKELPSKYKKMLHYEYEEDIHKLKQLINKDLTQWMAER